MRIGIDWVCGCTRMSSIDVLSQSMKIAKLGATARTHPNENQIGSDYGLTLNHIGNRFGFSKPNFSYEEIAFELSFET